MKILPILGLLFLVGCSSFDGRYQEDTKLIIQHLLYDLPLPATSDIRKEQTVILGTGGGWAGRIMLTDAESPAETLRYFSTQTASSGWTLVASTVSDQIVLVLEKGGRIATIEIFRDDFFRGGDTDVTISVHHPNAVQSLDPFNGYVPSTRTQ